MSCTTVGPQARTVYPRKVTRLQSPIITPDELRAECRQQTPTSIVKALQVATLVLTEDLKCDLDGFPYRDQLAAPRAVWARMHAVALEGVSSVLDALKKDLKDLAEGDAQ